MIPLKSENPLSSFPAINVLLIVVNFLVFLYELSLSPRAGNRLIYEFGLIPARIDMLIEPTRHAHAGLGSALIPIFTCMFLHAGWLHILGNMLFLWVFGASVEGRLGPWKYLAIYFAASWGPIVLEELKFPRSTSALVASLIPAFRASLISPLEALRAE